MERRIVISPVTRIEGHARVSIFLSKEGSVDRARFEVTSFRGFEKFCEGRPYYEMPSITSRACGICPVSHLLASAKACDDLVKVEVPRPAVFLRRLMHMGQIIQSHALNFFHLAAPDLLPGAPSEPGRRNVFGLMDTHPDIVRRGIGLRKFGQELIEQVAGKRIHSSDWIVPGGVKWPLPKERAEQLLLRLPEAQDTALESLSLFKNILEGLDEETRALGDIPTNYLGLVNAVGGLEHYDGRIRIVDERGHMIADGLDPKKYFDYIGEAVEPYSYMKFPFFKPLGYPEGSYRVGPLARLNVCSQCGTPLADEELREFRKLGRDGIVQSTFMYHYARLIEILYCIEHARELLEDEDVCCEAVLAKASFNSREGVGVAEAPRGTLVHHYKIDEQGMTTWVNMIIATEHCSNAYDKALTQVAKKHLSGKDITAALLNRVETVVRAFDPCLSCSCHAFGSSGLEVRLIGHGGELLDISVR